MGFVLRKSGKDILFCNGLAVTKMSTFGKPLSNRISFTGTYSVTENISHPSLSSNPPVYRESFAIRESAPKKVEISEKVTFRTIGEIEDHHSILAAKSNGIKVEPKPVTVGVDPVKAKPLYPEPAFPVSAKNSPHFSHLNNSSNHVEYPHHNKLEIDTEKIKAFFTSRLTECLVAPCLVIVKVRRLTNSMKPFEVQLTTHILKQANDEPAFLVILGHHEPYLPAEINKISVNLCLYPSFQVIWRSWIVLPKAKKGIRKVSLKKSKDKTPASVIEGEINDILPNICLLKGHSILLHVRDAIVCATKPLSQRSRGFQLSKKYKTGAASARHSSHFSRRKPITYSADVRFVYEYASVNAANAVKSIQKFYDDFCFLIKKTWANKRMSAQNRKIAVNNFIRDQMRLLYNPSQPLYISQPCMFEHVNHLSHESYLKLENEQYCENLAVRGLGNQAISVINDMKKASTD